MADQPCLGRPFGQRPAEIIPAVSPGPSLPDVRDEPTHNYPWTQVGISERRYYKLLPLFAQKVNGRYVLDHDDVVARMKAYLDRVDNVRAVRAAALDVLRSHGFGEEAARK